MSRRTSGRTGPVIAGALAACLLAGCVLSPGGSEPDDAEPVDAPDSTTLDTADASDEASDEVSDDDTSPADVFSWTISYTTWTIELQGFVAEASPDDADSACVLVTARASVELTGDHWWSGDYHRPKVELLAGSQRFEPRSLSSCDPVPAGLTELRSIRDVQVVDGMDVDIVAAFTVPTDLLRGRLTIAFADDEDADADESLYELDVLDSVRRELDSEPSYDRLPPTLPPDAVVRTLGEDQHDVAITGIWRSAASDIAVRDQGDGECVLVIGTATAVSAQNGDVTSGSPDVSLVAGGHRLPPARGVMCDVSEVEAAGYIHLASGQSVGNTFDFYAAVFVPADLADDVAFVVVGEPLDADVTFFDVVPLDDLPPAESLTE